MKGRLTWLCHASTSANRQGAFPADEPLEDRAHAQAAEMAGDFGQPDRVWVSPALRARQTADALGLSGSVEADLRDCDYGRWAGRRLSDLYGEQPEALAAWMTDPQAAPHGGETLADMAARVGNWMEARRGEGGRAVVVTHASVIRAAVLHVLKAPLSSFWTIDIEPLGLVEMTDDGRRWALRFARND